MSVTRSLAVGTAALGAVAALAVPGSAAGSLHHWRAPYTSSDQARFTSVVALGPHNVFAAGVADPYVNPPLVEHWDGTSWTAFHDDAFPADVQSSNGAIGIGARSTGDVWVTAGNSYGDPPVIVHWDGESWSDVPTTGLPPRWFGQVVLSGTTTRIVGIGSHEDPTDLTAPMIATYHAGDEPHWTVSRYARLGDLRASAVRNGHDTWSVGYSAKNEHTLKVHPLVEHWNGTNWRPVHMAGIHDLTGVAVASSKSVMAIGSGELNKSNDVKIWNGHRWHDVGSPKGHLYAVTPDPRGGYWVAGTTKTSRGVYYRFHRGHWTSHRGPARAVPTGTMPRPFVTAMDTSGGSVWAVGAHVTCPSVDDCSRATYNPFVDRH